MFKNTGIQKCLKLLISLSIYTPHSSSQFPVSQFRIAVTASAASWAAHNPGKLCSSPPRQLGQYEKRPKRDDKIDKYLEIHQMHM